MVHLLLLVLFAPVLLHAATCGDGSVGDGICYDPRLCCSEWGYCDNTVKHCSHQTNCGNGSVGNGRCDDPSQCCSIHGHCGRTAEHCGGTTPEQIPSTTTREHFESPRLIAFLGNWQDCPNRVQLASYTHIVISFAVSYTWSPNKNICSPTCQIPEPAICNNEIKPQLIREWQDQGKKVLLSFGGAGMGGSWEGDVNNCWDYCYGREAQVVDRLVDLVNMMGFDGIDIDFEDDVTPAAVEFLTLVTQGLRDRLPANAELSHVPMDSDIVRGKPYYDDVLKKVGPLLDFVMPQYYNGVTRPALDGLTNRGRGAMATLDHYKNLVHDIMDGDATRVVFGFCIQDCSRTNSNINAGQASIVLQELATNYYPCHGGAFFWVVKHDISGRWSMSVKSALDNLAVKNSCHLTHFFSSLGAMLEQQQAESTPEPEPNVIILPAPPASAPPPNTLLSPAFWEAFAALFINDDEEPTTPPPAPVMCCPPNYTGLRAYDDCAQYYHCVEGVVTGPLLKVPVGTLFDETMQNFNFANLVACRQKSSCSGTRNLRYLSP